MESTCPSSVDGKLRVLADMVKKNSDIGREQFRIYYKEHRQHVPDSIIERLKLLKAWQKKIDQALATRDGPLFNSLADTKRQVSAWV